MDEDLMRFETIWAAAGAPDTVFGTTPQALVGATGAKLIRVREGKTP
jgi:prolyl-tRNA editing enzyme YbaK/EbsC (Cys-tRNA(Pro) deacylase)